MHINDSSKAEAETAPGDIAETLAKPVDSIPVISAVIKKDTVPKLAAEDSIKKDSALVSLWSLSASFMPLLQHSIIKGNQHEAVFRRAHNLPAYGFSGALQVSRLISKHIFIQSGIACTAYNRQDYKEQAEVKQVFVDSLRAIRQDLSIFYFQRYRDDTSFAPVAYTSSYRYFSIPLSLQYRFSISKKYNAFISNGLMYNIVSISKTNTEYDPFKQVNHARTTHSGGDMLMLQLGMGISCRLEERISFSLSPSAIYTLKPVNKTSAFSERHILYGFQIGISYDLKNKSRR